MTKLGTAVLLALLLAPSSPHAGFWKKHAPSPCRQTAQDLLTSCADGAWSDYWLAVALCDNLSGSRDEKRACREQAVTGRGEAQTLCKDQYSGRLQVCQALGGAAYQPTIDPADFVDAVDNPFFPLPTGKTYVYDGLTDKGVEHDEVSILAEKKVILGVTCVVVRDVVAVDGKVIEDTFDWYAQDKEGNVWYFGEEAKQYVDGDLIGIEGSWKAGVNGALPGIIMEAHPAVGDIYRQEFAADTAEDMAKVLNLSASVSVTAGTYRDCLETEDFSPMEPGAVEHKYYAPGVGTALIEEVSTGGRLVLTEIR